MREVRGKQKVRTAQIQKTQENKLLCFSCPGDTETNHSKLASGLVVDRVQGGWEFAGWHFGQGVIT